ncbi:Allergen Asp f 4 [Penicillium canariense]|uniref:Allergen Asp f 4 n=1 Tax=Penicillium canariense TaxID=189055 RepID=A0A9W9LE57_9EURO|nr:Allergen Asp f 4 [Penicillium canariense]KAJ5151284.1 Allergen Asp f 4 [Penicillium canariense]
MHLSSYIPLLAAIGADYALGTHNHHGRHGHARLKRHAEHLEPRDVDWLDRIPADMMMEIRTTTTTVFEDCPSTKTIDATTTIFAQLIPVPTSAPAVATPDMPEPSKQEMAHSTPNSANLNENKPMRDEKTTTIHITTTVDITTTITIIKAASASVGMSIVGPSSTNTSIATRSVEASPAPAAPTTTTKPKAPAAGGLLPKLPPLPQLLEDAPKDVVSQLPLSDLPSLPLGQILDPSGPTVPSNLDWTAIPADGNFATERFGGRSKPSGSQIKYHGNVGIPWGSNVILVSPTEAHRYKYVVQFIGPNTQPWTITIWNKVGPDGKMDGWYGHSALTFVLAPGETRYVAFDEDSEGAWGAAPGTKGLPVDNWGGYTSTWGEFSFGDAENAGWSGWDVSAIQAQIAHQDVQGMRICMADGQGCSIITPQAKKVVNAYTESKRHHDGIGGAAAPGPVRLVVDIDYQEPE